MIVKFKKLDKKAVVPFKKHIGDFCYDVVAVSEEEIAPNVWRYGLGLAMQIDRSKPSVIGFLDTKRESGVFLNEDARISLDFRPRSSVWETGMVLANCEPTIDENYIGEIKLVFYHVMPSMPRYKVGDKIAQMKVGVTCPIKFIEVKELNPTDRGDGGFGSTGR